MPAYMASGDDDSYSARNDDIAAAATAADDDDDATVSWMLICHPDDSVCIGEVSDGIVYSFIAVFFFHLKFSLYAYM